MAKKANIAKKPTKRLKKGSKLEATKTLTLRKAGGGTTTGGTSGNTFLRFD